MTFRPIVLLLLTALTCTAQDWQSLSRLRHGDPVRVTLKERTVNDTFGSFTPEQVTVGSTTAKREDVLKVERYRQGGGRGRRAAFGALIGGGAGVVIGAAAASCKNFGPCVSRGQGAAVVGVVGAILGAGIGALIAHHPTELIYTLK